MNKRIQELYEQAHERKPYMIANPDTFAIEQKIGNGGVPMFTQEFNSEKFAELIIKDSEASILESFKSYSDGTNVSDYSEGYVNGMKDAIQLIKEHFGVKS